MNISSGILISLCSFFGISPLAGLLVGSKECCLGQVQ
jgi:hypothetical protein